MIFLYGHEGRTFSPRWGLVTRLISDWRYFRPGKDHHLQYERQFRMGKGRLKVILWDETESDENNLSERHPYQCYAEDQLIKPKGGTASKVSGHSWLYYMWLDVNGYC